MIELSKDIDLHVKLNEIFKNRCGINLFDSKYNESLEENLLGRKLNLKARDLIYILVDIEKEFNITIPEHYIEDNKFNTVNNLITIINAEINRS